VAFGVLVSMIARIKCLMSFILLSVVQSKVMFKAAADSKVTVFCLGVITSCQVAAGNASSSCKPQRVRIEMGSTGSAPS
jgi:hypothetical protein